MKFTASLAFLICLFITVDASIEAQAQSMNEGMDIISAVEEYDVPWEDSRSRDPYVAPDGKV
ncbi:MAG: hypothetical protein WD510_00950, partial [Balneolaceae bacterium]